MLRKATTRGTCSRAATRAAMSRAGAGRAADTPERVVGVVAVLVDAGASAAGGAALVLYNDGRKVTQKVEGGGDVEIKGRWLGNDFVVERKVSGGGKVTEDYLRSQDGKQLFVIVKFEGGRGPIVHTPKLDRAAP